jgi:outer membrane cobalamin receptor
MIDFEFTGASCGYSYCNVAEARSTGAELEARARVAGPLWASVGATLLRTRVADPGFDSASGGLFERDQRLLRRPDRTWTAELAYRTTPFSLSARLLAVGDRDDRFFGSTGTVRTTLASYQRIDLTARLRLTPQVATTVRVENLANVHYQTVYNFAAPRRTIQVGVRATN